MATTIEQIRESKKNIITIVQEKIDLSGDYNFRQIAKLREHKREELQPCDDERFLPARLNYDLLGEVLAAKHQMEMKQNGKAVKGYNETVNQNQNKKSLSMKIYLFIKKAQAAWKTIAKK